MESKRILETGDDVAPMVGSRASRDAWFTFVVPRGVETFLATSSDDDAYQYPPSSVRSLETSRARRVASRSGDGLRVVVFPDAPTSRALGTVRARPRS